MVYKYQIIHKMRLDGHTWREISNELNMPIEQARNDLSCAKKRGSIPPIQDNLMRRPKVVKK